MNTSTSGLDHAWGLAIIEEDVAWFKVGVNNHTVVVQKGGDLDQPGVDPSWQITKKRSARKRAAGMSRRRYYANTHIVSVERYADRAFLFFRLCFSTC